MDTSKTATKQECLQLLIRDHLHVMICLRLGTIGLEVNKDVCARVYDMYAGMNNGIFRGKPWTDMIQYWRRVTNA